jgi:hypothetical protein
VAKWPALRERERGERDKLILGRNVKCGHGHKTYVKTTSLSPVCAKHKLSSLAPPMELSLWPQGRERLHFISSGLLFVCVCARTNDMILLVIYGRVCSYHSPSTWSTWLPNVQSPCLVEIYLCVCGVPRGEKYCHERRASRLTGKTMTAITVIFFNAFDFAAVALYLQGYNLGIVWKY